MKRLIITAGLPGVGKSCLLRLIKKKIKCYYFDSDLFSKQYAKKHKINFEKLSKKELAKIRMVFHKAKLIEILNKFKKNKIIILDTCFDMPKSRALFYKFAKENKLNLEIIEVKCPENIVKQRIFKNKHERERMSGTRKGRWKVYKWFKAHWKPINKKHLIVQSNKPLEPQIKNLIKRLR